MKSAKKHTKFYKNVLWQYGMQAIKYLLPLIVFPYLTRVLEPSGYAVYGYIAALMVFVQTFVEYGFNLSGTKQIIEAKTINEKSRVVGLVFQCRLILSLVTLAIVVALINFIPILHENPLYTVLALVATCGRAFVPDFVFRGYEDMSPITLRYFASKGCSTALTFVVVKSAADLLWIPILDIIASAIALVWSFAAMKRRFHVTMKTVPLKECIKGVRISGIYCFSNMAAIVFSSFTTLVIGMTLPEYDIAYWSVSITIISAVQSLYSPIIDSMYPHMLVNGDYRFAKKVTLLALPALLVGTVTFAYLSPWIMMVAGGDSYEQGAVVLLLLSPVLLISFFSMYFGWPILGTLGRVNEVALTTVASALFCIGALILLSAFGYASLFSFCIVRCITELILAASRIVLTYVEIRKRRKLQSHS